MRIISWNVNGLRALHRQGYWQWVLNTIPDILCLQEIKATEDQLPPAVRTPETYHTYFSSSKTKKGYSGVAVYTTQKPTQVAFDVLPDEFNTEGRLIQCTFPEFTLINTYIPNGGRGKDRLEFKLAYYDALLEHIETLRARGESIVLCGDINTAHEAIDLARPRENADRSGFLPEERAWLDDLLRLGYIDTFRNINPNKTDAYTYWDQITRARERNVGWRIDYIFISPDLSPALESADILPQVYGSDHCPVSATLTL